MAGERAAGLTRQLLAFGRKIDEGDESVDLDAVLGELAPLLRRLVSARIEVLLERPHRPVTVRALRSHVEQVLFNLVLNAADAQPEEGRIAIRLEATPDEACLHVVDEGCGMTPEIRARVFEPFFTTKPPERGTGLGLSTVHGLVQHWRGRIEVESHPGEGTRFSVTWPVVPDEAPAPSAVPTPAGPLDGPSARVLLCEDDPLVREVALWLLREAEYEVFPFDCGVDALTWVDAEGAQVDLLLTDLIMPGMNGRELSVELRERLPHLKVLFMTGYAGDLVDVEGLDAEGALLAKPFDSETLLERVRQVLAR